MESARPEGSRPAIRKVYTPCRRLSCSPPGIAPLKSAGTSGAAASPRARPPKVTTTAAHITSTTAASVTFSIRGRRAMRAIRRAMARPPAVMVVAVCSRSAGERPGGTSARRVRP